jgi:NhaP-type Na+/H+ or K+/H+ antiporter
MSGYHILILISLLMLGSFGLTRLQAKLHLSSVVVLLLLGVLLQVGLSYANYSIVVPSAALNVLGTLGLLVIVLEAVLDIQFSEEYKAIIGKAALKATCIVITTMIVVSGVLKLMFAQISFAALLAYAIPLSIVSSAVVIPSLSMVKGSVSLYLLFESIMADIIGVLLFNFVTSSNLTSLTSIGAFALNLGLMIIISLGATCLLLLALNQAKVKNLNIVLFALLVLIYALSKELHLSALLLILVFGLAARNLPLLLAHSKILPRRLKQLDVALVESNLDQLQTFIDDLGFIIRSLFFVLLGYSIELKSIVQLKVLASGVAILILIYGVRWLFAWRQFSKLHERSLVVWCAPRGLISVLLFFQIPTHLTYSNLDGGVVFFVVVFSCLIMSYGQYNYTKQVAKETKLESK